MAKIISITNQKGGVGKSTTSINLSACLAVAEKKTLLIDLDPQGNSSVGVGISKDVTREKNIYHVLTGEKDISQCIENTELPYFDIVPSEKDLAGAEIELVTEIARESRLKMAIEKIRNQYDYIIIDCAPSLGLLTLNALNASTSYIVPMQTEYFSMEGLSQLIRTVKLVKNSINPDIEMDGVLLTMFDRRNNLHKQVAEEIINHFGEKVFRTIIPRNVKLSECPSFGKPVILYDIESTGSKAYFSLAKELIEKHKLDEAGPIEPVESTELGKMHPGAMKTGPMGPQVETNNFN